MTPNLDLNYVRNRFPALKNGFVFMDNAGGSQTLDSVIENISHYLTEHNVQLGASYKISQQSGAALEEAHRSIAGFINAKRTEEVVVGPSTSMLFRILSIVLSKKWQKGDEVIVTNSDHEANISPWRDLEKQGMIVKEWKINPETMRFDVEDLKALLSDKTRLVTMVHASNILGTINPIKEIGKVVHEAGSLFCVDGVAYAPHRMLDMQEWDVDFYSFSTYKVYGPHLAVMYGKYEILRELESFNHYFIGKEEVPYKLQPGNFNFELTYSLLGLTSYLKNVYTHHYSKQETKDERKTYASSYALMAEHEEALSKKLLDYLNAHSKIKVIGETTAAKEQRVPTISFIHEEMKSSDIVKKVDEYGIGIRFGDFYAKKIIEDLNLEQYDGVVRVSMVHYNTLEEVEQLIQALETILPA